MGKLGELEKQKVFYYFEKICSIPHGSRNMDAISDFLVEFAKEHNLKYVQDEAKNVIIYKPATKGYENSGAIIMQGHIDMVCQKTEESTIDFLKDAIDVYIDGDFIKAKGTTLGADNGIGAALILAVLDSDDVSHPPIEAVFTTDEEIGMLGAAKLDMTNFSAKKMINLDCGADGIAIVSCAGGVDIKISKELCRKVTSGNKVTISIDGLLGGHSGSMIHLGRINANVLMGRILSYAKRITDFDILNLCGGDKGNVITSRCRAELVVSDVQGFCEKLEEYFDKLKEELTDREPDLDIILNVGEKANFNVISKETKDLLIYLLVSLPNGVVDMSKKIPNLVETSLNLGILNTDEDKSLIMFTARSNKQSSLNYIQEKLFFIAEYNGCTVEASGHYPPWEYKEGSEMQKIYLKTYSNKFDSEPIIKAVHAGLEGGVFTSKIEGLDCISMGPDMADVHTVNERLSISGTENFYDFLIYFLSECK